MLEAAGAAGLGVFTAVLAAALPAPQIRGLGPPEWLRRVWRREAAMAAAAGVPGLTAGRMLATGLVFGCLAGVAGAEVTGMPVLATVAAVAGAAAPRILAGHRVAALGRARQDAVLESVRTLRQVLEAGGVGVQQGLSVLAERGPDALRQEFRAIVAAGVTGRQAEAWTAARARVAQPLFDLLAAAILVQRPGGGELGPLFQDLEESVTGIHEVVREAEALQVQARSAAVFILALPLVFLGVLVMLRSPYLNAYRTPGGELFLGAMLAVMVASYVWIRRWLRLPEEPRLEVADA